jgi:uncharacterized protein DUF1330
MAVIKNSRATGIRNGRKFALGAAAVQVLHAQAKPPAYVVAEITVKDQEGYKNEFLPVRVKEIQEAGGKVVVRGGNPISFEGAPPHRASSSRNTRTSIRPKLGGTLLVLANNL